MRCFRHSDFIKVRDELQSTDHLPHHLHRRAQRKVEQELKAEERCCGFLGILSDYKKLFIDVFVQLSRQIYHINANIVN